MQNYALRKIAEPEEDIPSLDKVFEVYCQMDLISNAMGQNLLPLSQSDKWLSKAGILDMIKLTTTDTGLCFFKFRKRAISFEEYLSYLEDLANTKNLKLEDMKFKLQTVREPFLLDKRRLGEKMKTKLPF